MKKLILNFAALAFAINTWAQAPQMMSYQAVIRDASNVLVASTTVGMKVSILQGSPTGSAVYVETQSSNTNLDGLSTIQIGSGTVVSGTFNGINWAAGPYFLKTETDPTGGTNYTISGTSQLMSVPYALYSKTSGSPGNGWGLSGNTGTRDTINFIGTTDKVPFNIIVNNHPSGRIDSASGNTFLGYEAGNFPSNKGNNNIAVGNYALLDNTTGANNTANGYAALKLNTSGSNNTGTGFCQLVKNTTGGSNTAYGTWALFQNTTASFNTAVGDSALYVNTTGTGNTSIGYGALVNNTTGNNNTAIGYMADAGAANNNSTVIGYQATANQDNVIVLGNSSIQKIYCAQTTITAISDGRFKKNINSDIHGLDFIMKLKPVSYNLDVTKLNAYQGKKVNAKDQESVKQAEAIRHNGFIAQDVEKAAKQVNYNFSGLKTPENSSDIYGLGYTDFVVPLVKAVQELNAANENLKAENAMLKTQLDNQTSKINNLQNAQASNEKELAAIKALIYTQTEKAEVSKK